MCSCVLFSLLCNSGVLSISLRGRGFAEAAWGVAQQLLLYSKQGGGQQSWGDKLLIWWIDFIIFPARRRPVKLRWFCWCCWCLCIFRCYIFCCRILLKRLYYILSKEEASKVEVMMKLLIVLMLMHIKTILILLPHLVEETVLAGLCLYGWKL